MPLLITSITASLFCAAVNVDFRPICMPSSQVMQPATPRNGVSTHIKGSHRYRYAFATRTRARFAVAKYTEVFYNPKRMHSTIDY
ncbi:MAG: hypothetical protein ACKN9D_11840, partial [Actinomycetales bacterium]